MDEWTLAIVLFDIAAIALLVRLRRRALPAPAPKALASSNPAEARTYLTEAAEALGLDLVVQGMSASLSGGGEGAEVRVEPLGVLERPEDPRAFDLSVAIQDPVRLAEAFRLAPRPADEATMPTPLLGARSFEVGDSVFDQRFEVNGAPPDVRARLSALNRQTLVALPGRLVVRPGQLTYATRALFEGAEAIVEAVQQAWDALDAVQTPADDAARFEALRTVALADPEPRVRAPAFAELHRHYPEEPGTAEAAKHGCGDPDARVRLEAAIALGEDGEAVLEALALGEHPLEVRQRAVRQVGAALPVDAAREVLGAVLGAPTAPPKVVIEAAATLARHGVPGGVEALLARLETAPAHLAAGLLRALGDYDAPEAEPAILTRLHARHLEIRLAAAGALGAVGTPAALEPVRARLAREDDPEVQGRLQWALTQIHARHAVEAGRLSISAAADDGALSVAETGGLAIAPPDAGSEGA